MLSKSILYPSTIAAVLLRQTAELAPQQLPQRVWQTIALRRPIADSGYYRSAGPRCICELALLLAEIDQDRAREVARWLPSPSSGSIRFESYVRDASAAGHLIAELSPGQCETALQAVTDPSTNRRLRLTLVKSLIRTGESRSRAIRHAMTLWFPDDEDSGPIQ